MRVHVVSDVHGRTDALARAADGADALIVLGDLLEAVDYTDPSAGIMGRLYGADNVAHWIGLRTAQRFREAGEFSRAMLAAAAVERDADPQQLLLDAIRQEYREVFAAMPSPAWCTYGNVDAPQLWPEFTRDGIQVLDGEVAEIGGLRVGFVGGGIGDRPSRYPYLVTEEQFAAKVAALGPVDVLCSHIPPAVPELCYDTVARRFERGSHALLDAVREHQPRMVLFGHVHQPLHLRTRVGRTECVNVGHFRETGVPYAVTW
ncbi:MAG TPA: metallophosphoesterase [Mycobacteriales bacterium]|jgi:Icc-related predicted phosphoesterase|nr:metallophosphoesterase [Cryptosporangiaceae bacterium]HEV7757268.1 metallophosphoesterase [Mycobacteriales bacterium]